MPLASFVYADAFEIPAVTIKSDGSIDPPNVPISRMGDSTYVMTGNLTGYCLVVERSNVIVDGAGYTFEGKGAWYSSPGILVSANYVTVENFNITNFGAGAIYINSSWNTITKNTLVGNNAGVGVLGSNNNITGNYDLTDGVDLLDNWNTTYRDNCISYNGNHVFQIMVEPNESHCVIVGNNITLLQLRGDFNTIYLNNFFKYYEIGSVWLSNPPSVGNRFDNGSVGNFWSTEYTGTDANGDGIGDTPRLIGENISDNHPLMTPVNLTTLTPPTPFTSSPVENSWVPKADAPGTDGYKAAAVNGKIYLIERSSIYEYNLQTNTWTTKTPMPVLNAAFAVAACQNKIYVIGEASNRVYDPVTDTWENKTAMPTSRSYMEANAVGGKIYVIGGRTGDAYTTVPTNEVYDCATDTWSTKADIPYPVVRYSSAVIGTKIYIIGGQDEYLNLEMNVKFTQIYDTVTDTWSQGTPIPVCPMTAAACATTGTHAPVKIYVMGGDTGFIEPGNRTFVYNPENESWTVGAAMLTPRLGYRLVVVDDLLYAVGGTTLGGGWVIGTAANEQYTPFGYNTVTPTPTPSPSPSPTPTTSATPTLLPTESPSPLPTPTTTVPEFSVAMLGVVGVVLLAGCVVWVRRRRFGL
jgi:hypothetical protein